MASTRRSPSLPSGACRIQDEIENEEDTISVGYGLLSLFCFFSQFTQNKRVVGDARRESETAEDARSYALAGCLILAVHDMTCSNMYRVNLKSY